MRFHSWDALKEEAPFCNGEWDKDKLEEYLIQSCNKDFNLKIKLYFAQFRKDENLVDLLFSFLLDDYYDGSDSQMGAARVISRMDHQLLRKKKDLLLRAQENEVDWKRPFLHDEHLEWLEG